MTGTLWRSRTLVLFRLLSFHQQQKKPQKKQKDEMRSEMRGGRAFRELGESRERKVTKVNRTVPARCRLEWSICSARSENKSADVGVNVLLGEFDQTPDFNYDTSSPLWRRWQKAGSGLENESLKSMTHRMIRIPSAWKMTFLFSDC